jgi:hypothetical protein
MIRTAHRHWPLIAAVAVLWSAVAAFSLLSIRRNEGHFAYALDDAYIHMAIAKNLAQHRVWGLSQYGFNSSSSSLLWTSLLALVYCLFGVNEITPFVLNLIFATSVCGLAHVLLRKFRLHDAFILAALLLLIFITPLISLIFSGLEHILHTLISIAFVYCSANALAGQKSTSPGRPFWLLLAPLLVMARYEGLFMVLIVGCLLVLRGQVKCALLLFGLGILPVTLYGLFSVAHGWYFLPNSVLLKGNAPKLTSLRALLGLAVYTYHQLWENRHVLMLVLAALAILCFQQSRSADRPRGSAAAMMTIILIATTLLHVLFARTGWFYRYEAYLVALGIFVAAASLGECLPARLPARINATLAPGYGAWALLVLLVMAPFILRAKAALAIVPRATTNIYQQQYQMGRFVREFYQGDAIAANDIGAVNYLAEIKCLDLVGLGSLDVAKAKQAGCYTTRQIRDLARSKQVRIAIVYDHWLQRDGIGGVPPEWIKVGQWKISDNVVCGGDTVSFYAVDPSAADRLRRDLGAFADRLPRGVAQAGEYVNRQAVGGRRKLL